MTGLPEPATPSMYFKDVPEQNQWKLDMNLDFGNDEASSECDLEEITKVMYEWKGTVSTALELTPADVASIETKHRGDLNSQLKEVLRLWKQKLGQNATYRNLIIAFLNAGKSTYAEAVSNVLKTELEVIDPVGRTVETYVNKIMAELSNDDIIEEVGIKLYQARLISSSTLEDIRDTTIYDSMMKKSIMLQAVQETIASQHQMLDKFLTVLSETVLSTTMPGLISKMKETFELEKIKRQGTPQSQVCRKQNMCINHDQALPPRKKVKTERNPFTMSCITLLKVYYKRKAKATDKKFPYKCPKKYINLVLIRRDNLTKRQKSNLMSSSIHGNIDDILDATSKSMISIEEIALPNEDGSLPTFILILGAPGVGKSIFAWHLAQQWAEGVLLQDYSIVILLRARDSKVQNATELVQLLYFIENVQVRKSLVKDIIDINGSGVFFILDGYDELPSSKREFFDKFLRGEILPGATVLVTSRPSASDHILMQCSDMSQHIEILGFTKENIWSCATTAMPERKMLESFKRYLSCYPHIHSAMYIPLNCVFVIQVYKENWEENEEIVILKTMTELYTSLVRSHILRDKGCRQLIAIESIPNYDKFLQLCLFAYESILKNKVVFSGDELPPGLEHFSLMQTDQELYIDEGCSTTHNFIHLTIEEFLAAFHVSKQPVAFQKEFVKEHFHNNMLNVVIKFIAGLTKLHAFDEASLKELVCPMESGKRTISIDGLHILFELQDSALIACILNEDLVFRHIGFPRLTPYDYHVLGFSIANSSAMWNLLLWTEMNQESATMFSLGILPDGQDTGQDDMRKQVVKRCGCSSLYMQGLCRVLPFTIQSLLKAGIFKRMTSLSLRNAGLDTEACVAISTSILNYHSLKRLDLVGNSALFVQGGEEQLVFSLNQTNTIHCLLLELTRVRNGKAIADLLEHCTSLSLLDCDANKLSRQEAKRVLIALQINRNLKIIALSEADLSGENCELLAKVLKSNQHSLQKLFINKCNIDSEGAVQIAEALRVNTSLSMLHISTNHIGKLGAEAFAEMLSKHNRTITKLMISDQSMGKEGVQKLMDSLSCNSVLELIDLPNTFEHMWKDYVPRPTLKINWIYENHSFSMAPN